MFSSGLCQVPGSRSEPSVLKCYATPSEVLKDPHNDTLKVEPEVKSCFAFEDICINVESTLGFKIKGCGKLEHLESFAGSKADPGIEHLLDFDIIEIEENECKKFPSVINRGLKVENDYAKIALEKQKMTKKGSSHMRREKELKRWIEMTEGLEFHTICTCSADLCNNGVQIEAKNFTVLLFSFIVSKLFIG